MAQGDFLINGFRNRDLRLALQGAAADPIERRRQSAAITRRLAILRAHGVIYRVQKTHRYQVTAAGKRLLTALSTAYAANVDQLGSAA